MSPVICHEHVCHKQNQLLNAPFLLFLKHVPGSSFADAQCPLEVIFDVHPTVYFFIGNHVLPRYSQHSSVEPCFKCRDGRFFNDKSTKTLYKYLHDRLEIKKHKMHTSRERKKERDIHFVSLNNLILNWKKSSAYVPF